MWSESTRKVGGLSCWVVSGSPDRATEPGEARAPLTEVTGKEPFFILTGRDFSGRSRKGLQITYQYM